MLPPLLLITCPFSTVSEYKILKPFMFGLLLLLIHLNLIYPCVHVCIHACVGHTCGGQKTTYRDHFSLSSRQVLGKELIASGLAACVTTHQAISCHQAWQHVSLPIKLSHRPVIATF